MRFSLYLCDILFISISSYLILCKNYVFSWKMGSEICAALNKRIQLSYQQTKKKLRLVLHLICICDIQNFKSPFRTACIWCTKRKSLHIKCFDNNPHNLYPFSNLCVVELVLKSIPDTDTK